jgi:hypothetical protein
MDNQRSRTNRDHPTEPNAAGEAAAPTVGDVGADDEAKDEGEGAGVVDGGGTVSASAGPVPLP